MPVCIAICKPAGSIITKETLEICWDNNPHGAGYAYVNPDGRVIVRKFMTFEAFYNEFAIVDAAFGEDSNMLIHFRITSRGATRIDNCHPFQINDKMAMIHNGTISSMPYDKEHQHSDTYMFNELILKKLPEGWEDNEGIHYLIEDILGRGSKVAVLHAEKGFTIYNEELGMWDNGIWYSNSGFRRYTYSTSYYYTPKSNYQSTTRNVHDWEKDPIPKKKQEPVKSNVLSLEHKRAEQTITEKEEKEVLASVEPAGLIQCDDCFNYHPHENLLTIQGATQDQIKFICEDCCDIRLESFGTINFINLDEQEYQEEVLERMAYGTAH